MAQMTIEAVFSLVFSLVFRFAGLGKRMSYKEPKVRLQADNFSLSLTGRRTWSGWLELVRLPNLFTIPGDILAGAFLAHLHHPKLASVIPVLIISLALYCAGLLLNDYYDRNLDQVERPHRPIPSGRIRPGEVLSVAIGLLILAFALSLITAFRPQTIFYSFPSRPVLFWITLAIAGLILFYNQSARQIPLVGFLTLGLCRAANLLLGASLSAKPFSHLVLSCAGLEALYITIVSLLAVVEAESLFPAPKAHNLKALGKKSWLLLLPCLGLMAILLKHQAEMAGRFMSGLVLGAFFLSLGQAVFSNSSLPQTIGKLLRSLIFIQGFFLSLSINHLSHQQVYGFLTLAVLFLCFILAGWTSHHFTGS